mmetsp:Transcript_28543/g.34966  ORF Transcript_28543/g.34966 Transcript_28543/m.34966 type:complete len:101 (-) Transcript_28543:40-342(-)
MAFYTKRTACRSCPQWFHYQCHHGKKESGKKILAVLASLPEFVEKWSQDPAAHRRSQLTGQGYVKSRQLGLRGKRPDSTLPRLQAVITAKEGSMDSLAAT